MLITFIGSGAATHRRTPEHLIPEGARRCSSTLLDNDVLLDVPIHAFDYMKKLGLDPSAVTDILLTHSHPDHFWKETFLRFAEAAPSRLRLWCHASAIQYLHFTDEDLAVFDLCTVDLMQKVEIDGLSVMALPANHSAGANEQAINYIVEKGGKRLFYAVDSGSIRAEAWTYIYRNDIVMDCVIFETTVGDTYGDPRFGSHTSIPVIRVIYAGFLKSGKLKENGTFISTHIAQSAHGVTIEETRQILAQIGIVMALDGESVEI